MAAPDAEKLLLSDNKATVEEALEKLLDQEECGYSEEVCQNLLTVIKAHPDLRSKVAEVLAFFAREEKFRDIAHSCGVISSLCPLISSDERGIQLHTLRAVGNLCFDHDSNRELLLSNGGCPLLVDRLKSVSSLPVEKEFDRLKCVCCGCLLNVINDNDKLCQDILNLGALEYLSSLLANPGEDSLTISMGLKTLYILLDSESGESIKLSASKSVSRAFATLLDRCAPSSGDLTDQLTSLLETIEVAIKDNEEVMVALIEEGCAEKLSLVSDPILLVKAIDLLILICAKDKCLKQLSGQKWLVEVAMDWLEENHPLRVRANAALLVANMARTDEMCEVLISSGVVAKLLPLTHEVEEPEELSGKVHVSALSALRNFCVPASLKTEVVEKGVLKAALQCLRHDEWPHVHFKSLGIARLLATQQDVCKELTEPGTVRIICERCPMTGEPAHVRIEGSRLLSAVVKHCKSNDVMKVVISEGGVKLISSLLDSTHLSLRNEALLALNLMTLLGGGGGGGGEEETARVALTDEAVVGGVWGVVCSSDSTPELVSNAMTFLTRISDIYWTDELRERMVGLNGLVGKLDSLIQHESSSETVSSLANQLMKKLSLNTDDGDD